ncbi:MAG: hypothetical protein Kow0068_17860 [Marinilabiliales bacterium]
MKRKIISFKFIAVATMFILAGLLYNCKSESETQNVEDIIDDAIDVEDDLADDFNKAKQVFYSLPSPIETAMLMKRAGAKYNEEYLNSVDNLPNYTTNKSMALNLGVYSADLSFASMFDQSQASIKYLTATKKLAEDLGILNAIDQKIVKRMEENVNNRDSLMEIISETFMNSNSFLKENDRAETAAVILVGGWIEGVYIATKITQATSANKELIDRIIDQRLSLSTLISLCKEYPDDETVASLLPELEKLKAVFDKIQVSSTKIEAMTEENTNVTTLKSQTETSISPEVFEELCTTIDEIRNSITQ